MSSSGQAHLRARLAVGSTAVDEPIGLGRVVLFPIDMNFRAITQGTQRVLRNAILGPDPL